MGGSVDMENTDQHKMDYVPSILFAITVINLIINIFYWLWR